MLTSKTKVIPINGTQSKVIGICPWCNKKWEVVALSKDLLKWQLGQLVQNVFTYLNEDERELFISGVCSDCWENLKENTNEC